MGKRPTAPKLKRATLEEYAELSGRSALQIMRTAGNWWLDGYHYERKGGHLIINVTLADAWHAEIDEKSDFLEVLQGGVKEIMAVTEMAYHRETGWMHDPLAGTFLYIFSNGEYIKVGISSTPELRIRDIQTANPVQIVFERAYLPVSRHVTALTLESVAHKDLRDYRVRGEWFHKEAFEVFKKFENDKKPTRITGERK